MPEITLTIRIRTSDVPKALELSAVAVSDTPTDKLPENIAIAGGYLISIVDTFGRSAMDTSVPSQDATLRRNGIAAIINLMMIMAKKVAQTPEQTELFNTYLTSLFHLFADLVPNGPGDKLPPLEYLSRALQEALERGNPANDAYNQALWENAIRQAFEKVENNQEDSDRDSDDNDKTG